MNERSAKEKERKTRHSLNIQNAIIFMTRKWLAVKVISRCKLCQIEAMLKGAKTKKPN